MALAAGFGRQGEARLGKERLGLAGTARQGEGGMARQGMAGRAGTGRTRPARNYYPHIGAKHEQTRRFRKRIPTALSAIG